MDDLYWILRLYSEDQNKYTFNELCEEITKDRDTSNINIKQNIIFDNEECSNNIDKILKKLKKQNISIDLKGFLWLGKK